MCDDLDVFVEKGFTRGVKRKIRGKDLQYRYECRKGKIFMHTTVHVLVAALASSSALLPPLQFRSPQRISQLRCIAPAQDDETDALVLTQPPPSAAAAAVTASLSLLAIAASFSLVEPVHAASATAAATAVLPPSIIFETAAKKALGGGISGFFAGIVQVLLLMWLRTTMNYQYRNGGSTRDALAALYAEGGLRRFYRGVSFALIQTPLSRFGDTAANTGVLALLADSTLPVGVRTAFASAAAAAWRIGLTPIDTLKTTLQVKGAEGYDQVSAKVKEEGPGVLYQGALANAAASFVGNYPWYLTFNSLNEMLPTFGEDLPLKLARTAVLGIAAAGVSDTISNSIRVLKTVRAACRRRRSREPADGVPESVSEGLLDCLPPQLDCIPHQLDCLPHQVRQTSETTITYREAAQQILETDGWQGLVGRGLGTRLVTNALQAALFTVVWKLGEEYLTKSGLLGAA